MTPRTRKLALGVTLSLLLVPALVFAARSGLRAVRAGAPGAMLQHVIQRLDLSPEQVTEIKGIVKTHQVELQAEIAAVATARGAMFDAIHADAYDEAAIRGTVTAVGAAETRLALTRGQIVQEVRGVLTAEQQAKAKEMLARLKTRMQDGLTIFQDRLAAFAS